MAVHDKHRKRQYDDHSKIWSVINAFHFVVVVGFYSLLGIVVDVMSCEVEHLPCSTCNYTVRHECMCIGLRGLVYTTHSCEMYFLHFACYSVVNHHIIRKLGASITRYMHYMYIYIYIYFYCHPDGNVICVMHSFHCYNMCVNFFFLFLYFI